jgi:outer membrane protein assembly factor BamA
MVTSRGLVAAALSFLFVLTGPSLSAAREDFLGRTISSITLTADGKISEEDLRSKLTLATGESLEMDAVARSIRALHASGVFRNIRVDAEHTDDGSVALEFVLSLHFRLDLINFDGLPDGEKAAEQLVPIRIGDVASLDAIDRGATEIQGYLERRGYMEAVVDPVKRRAPTLARIPEVTK